MSVEINKGEPQPAAEVVEKRVKPTLIRRRAKKVEEQPAGEVLPEGAVAAEVSEAKAAKKPSAEVVAKKTKDAQVKDTKAQATPENAAQAAAVAAAQGPDARATFGPALAAPSEAERKIGVVGYIDLNATPGVVRSAKEDWRDKLKKGPRKRKNRAELEMETIQRTGGLKQYVGALDETVVAEAEVGSPAAADKVFQPIATGKRKKVTRKEFKKTQITEPKAIKKIIRIEDGITVSALSQALGIKTGDIIKKLMDLSIMATVNEVVNVETATLIAGEYGFTVEHTAFKEEDVLVLPEAHASAKNLLHRAPVVTVMGHVDHGKTSILDVIRKSKVAEGEAGGITQHIGAYEVKHPKGMITFLDTPGHEAFTTMRARGAQATDIVVLVVAADDGIMPQTIEAIAHAKAAGVPIVVAINKIDKSNAQPDRVKQSLTEHGLVPEDWGGDIICVNTSARTKEGIDQLLDMILLQSEILELKADPTIRPSGIVIEASLDKGRGPLATVLVQEGTLFVGSYVVCGAFDGKIRAMIDATGRQIKEARPSQPVVILGLSGVPSAGDDMVGIEDERGAKLVTEQRRHKAREQGLTKPVHASLEDLSQSMADGEQKQLGVIIKTDVHGSVEAVSNALQKLSTEKVSLKILHAGVGGITENDVMLASASDAVVLGFNVMPDGMAREAAERENIEVRTYRIIYEMIDEVRKAMEGLLAPITREVVQGQAEVKNIFNISKVGTIAGCQVISGKVPRSARVRLLRDLVLVFEGKMSSLKRFKDDAREVAEGYECGIGIEGFNDIKVGDIIEAYIIESKAAKLES